MALRGIPSSTTDIFPGHNSLGVPSIICFKGAYAKVKKAPVKANTIERPTNLAIQLPIDNEKA